MKAKDSIMLLLKKKKTKSNCRGKSFNQMFTHIFLK